MGTGRLSGKTALITAAAAGIGRETAVLFAQEGARLVATDIDEAGLESLARQAPGIQTARLDVTNPLAIREFFAQHEFDVVFNCAGWVHHGNILSCGEEAWRRSFEINVDSTYRVCRAAIPGMISAGGGSIINVSSVVSSLKGAANRLAYAASKAAVIGLTKSIATDYVEHNIRCNVVCPGTILTPSLRDRVAALGGSPEEVWKEFADRQPMRRLGEPREVAYLAVYLASDESTFTTGTVCTVDGGWSS